MKISDFGISKCVDGTVLKTKIGTEGYLAPEIYGHYPPGDKSDEDTDSDSNEEETQFSLAVDIWAVGAMSFQMVTNRLPFRTPRELSKYVKSKKSLPITASISSNCANLLIETMNASSFKRPTAEKALSHVWVQTESSKVPEVAASSLIIGEIRSQDVIVNEKIKPTVYATWSSQPETKF